ncbi:GP63, leishmanolysin [Leishmania tarentolae]|uniref:GP63, leishmanolysin n=1 Tax=Leishmania tarentolae TaxID=5689 RepID=A0A640KWI4_LEITA|nr:GP63, leishmanolysin [Leishmania tarentolae]
MRRVNHCLERTTLNFPGSAAAEVAAASEVTNGRPTADRALGAMPRCATDCSTRACMLSWMQRCWSAPPCAHAAAEPTATAAAVPAAARRTRRAATLRGRCVLLLSTDMAV